MSSSSRGRREVWLFLSFQGLSLGSCVQKRCLRSASGPELVTEVTSSGSAVFTLELFHVSPAVVG